MHDSEPDAPAPNLAASAGKKAVYLRESTWLVFATFAAGALMWLVHFLNKYIPKEEYGTLGTLMTSLILVPTIPLQMVFAHQTAAAFARGRQKELAGMLHLALGGAVGLWLMGALVVVLLRNVIMARFDIASPAALWVTLAVILVALCTPMFAGLLHGHHRFRGLGWVLILQGVGRAGGAGFCVIVMGAMSAGIMTGALIGCLTGLGLSAWLTRELWLTRGVTFARNRFLHQVFPLVLGFASYQFLLSADTILVNAFFDREETAHYFAAGTLSRALVWIVGPLAAVTFPKMVRGSIRAEKSDLLAVTLVGTTVLVAVGAVGLCWLGPIVVRLVYDATYVAPTLAILPWYAGAMVPLCLAAVMVNSLMARFDFRIVPWLLAIAAGYALSVILYHPNTITVLQLLGIFCMLAFLAGAWFTWIRRTPDSIPSGH